MLQYEKLPLDWGVWEKKTDMTKTSHSDYIYFPSKDAMTHALKQINEFLRKYEIFVPVYTESVKEPLTSMRHLFDLYEECGMIVAKVMYMYPSRQNFDEREEVDDNQVVEEDMLTEIFTTNHQKVHFVNQMGILIPFGHQSNWILFTDIVQAIYPFTSFTMIDFLMATRDRDTAVARVFRHTLCERQLFRWLKSF